jgi:hypothetical protein
VLFSWARCNKSRCFAVPQNLKVPRTQQTFFGLCCSNVVPFSVVPLILSSFSITKLTARRGLLAEQVWLQEQQQGREDGQQPHVMACWRKTKDQQGMKTWKVESVDTGAAGKGE